MEIDLLNESNLFLLSNPMKKYLLFWFLLLALFIIFFHGCVKLSEFTNTNKYKYLPYAIVHNNINLTYD
jgi:hypothetical protein